MTFQKSVVEKRLPRLKRFLESDVNNTNFVDARSRDNVSSQTTLMFNNILNAKAAAQIAPNSHRTTPNKIYDHKSRISHRRNTTSMPHQQSR